MTHQALRKRLNELAERIEFIADRTLEMYPTREHASDIRALLAAHKEAKRELSACKRALRHLQCVQARDADSAIILQTAFLELMKKRIKL